MKKSDLHEIVGVLVSEGRKDLAKIMGKAAKKDSHLSEKLQKHKENLKTLQEQLKGAKTPKRKKELSDKIKFHKDYLQKL